MQVDIQRFTEDAQQEVTQLQQQLQDEFQRKLTPVIQQVATERQLHMMFSVVDSGLVWGDPALDLTPEIIKRFDAAAPGAPGCGGASGGAAETGRTSGAARRARARAASRRAASHAAGALTQSPSFSLPRFSRAGSCSGFGGRGSGFLFGRSTSDNIEPRTRTEPANLNTNRAPRIEKRERLPSTVP